MIVQGGSSPVRPPRRWDSIDSLPRTTRRRSRRFNCRWPTPPRAVSKPRPPCFSVAYRGAGNDRGGHHGLAPRGIRSFPMFRSPRARRRVRLAVSRARGSGVAVWAAPPGSRELLDALARLERPR